VRRIARLPRNSFLLLGYRRPHHEFFSIKGGKGGKGEGKKGKMGFWKGRDRRAGRFYLNFFMLGDHC